MNVTSGPGLTSGMGSFAGVAMMVDRFDVVVAGGGAAGVAAACAAAKAGAETLLLERYGFLGGAATSSNVLSYCGFYRQGPVALPAVGGIGRNVLDRLAQFGWDVSPRRAPSGNWIILLDPEALKLVLDEEVAAAGVTCSLHSTVTGADVDERLLRSIRVSDHTGTRSIEAAAFVDASGDGNLAACAGHPMSVDSAAGDKVQPASYPIRVGGIPFGKEPDRRLLAEAAAAVNGRLNAPLVRDSGGVFFRLASGEYWWMCIELETGGLSGADLSEAERQGRRLAWDCVAELKHRSGLEGMYIVSTGPQIGIRESRRPTTRFTMTGDYAAAGGRSMLGVAHAAWPMEVHQEPGKVSFISIGGDGFFDVPLPALQAAMLDNLWLGGRLAGADVAAYGSIRVMGTGFATGQAAGVAAALTARAAEFSPTGVQEIIRQQGGLV